MLLGIAGVARIMGWLPNSIFDFGNVRSIEVLSKAAAEPVGSGHSQSPSDASSAARCPEIASSRLNRSASCWGADDWANVGNCSLE